MPPGPLFHAVAVRQASEGFRLPRPEKRVLPSSPAADARSQNRSRTNPDPDHCDRPGHFRWPRRTDDPPRIPRPFATCPKIRGKSSSSRSIRASRSRRYRRHLRTVDQHGGQPLPVRDRQTARIHGGRAMKMKARLRNRKPARVDDAEARAGRASGEGARGRVQGPRERIRRPLPCSEFVWPDARSSFLSFPWRTRWLQRTNRAGSRPCWGADAES